MIGPDEPVDRAAHRGVFASHYDEGRITRALDADVFWSRVSRASIARYRALEAESGVAFFSDTGAMMAGPASGVLMRSVADVQAAEGIAADRLEGAILAARFPYFRFEDDVLAFHELTGAGHLSPRCLVRAQGILAQKAGAEVMVAEATALSDTASGVTVQTSDGPVTADQVLVAAGGFSNMVLPQPLPIRVYARTVAFFELDDTEVARLSGMPSLVYQAADGRDPYLLPPIRYPNGKTYLKLGGDPADMTLASTDAIKAWFHTAGSPQVGADLRAHILARMPGLRISAMHTEACVTTFTAADRPAIRHLNDRVAVAVAGCGRGAKCSDELGRMAAALFAPVQA
jgi:sarcosine oxidase